MRENAAMRHAAIERCYSLAVGAAEADEVADASAAEAGDAGPMNSPSPPACFFFAPHAVWQKCSQFSRLLYPGQVR